MKNVSSKLLSFVILFISINGFENESKALERLPTESGNYCVDEALVYMRKTFGDDFMRINSNHSSKVEYLGQIRGCNGHVVLEFPQAKRTRCVSARYGKRSTYLRIARPSLWGNCADIFDRENVRLTDEDFAKYLILD